MKKKAARNGKSRKILTRENVLREAITIADQSGIASLSMRKLGQALGVEAMSLYNHVANKDEILDGIIELVIGEIELPSAGVDWKIAMRRRAISAHEVLLRHPWAPTLMESRMSLGPAKLRYFDAVIGTLRNSGFSTELASHAFLTMDSYIYGFILQELSWQFEKQDRHHVIENLQPQMPAGDYPHLAELMGFIMNASREEAGAEGGGAKGYESEFEFGLDLILDGLEQLRDKG